MEKIKILGLPKKEKEAAIKKVTENGKKEIVELKLYRQGKVYEAIILIDFTWLRKAMSALVDISSVGSGKNAQPKVTIDEMGAGDKLLFGCFYDGDKEAIWNNMALRTKATKKLGAWVQEYMNEQEGDDDSEKKD